MRRVAARFGPLLRQVAPPVAEAGTSGAHAWAHPPGASGPCIGSCTTSPWALLARRAAASKPPARPGALAGAGGGGGGIGPAAAGGAAAAASAPAAGAAPARSTFDRWRASWRAVPTIPKWLGLTGAIPFIALAPPVSKHLFWLLPHDMIDNSATFQVGYGISIVTFLGAVHWGLAMGSAAMASPLMARAARESYLYSVAPSLCSFWLAGVEPAPASALLALLVGGCYFADKLRANYLPAWYLTLRLPLTLAATYGLLLTATYYYHLDQDRLAALEAARAAAGGGGSGSSKAG